MTQNGIKEKNKKKTNKIDVHKLPRHNVYACVFIHLYISVTRGGQGVNCPPPPPIMPFRSFVGTFGNFSVHVSRQACHLYRQSI